LKFYTFQQKKKETKKKITQRFEAFPLKALFSFSALVFFRVFSFFKKYH